MTVFAKTAAGLYIGQGELAAIEARRNNGCWVLDKCSRTPLSGEAMPPKDFKENIRKTLKESGIKNRKISVSVPDTIAKTVFLEFKDLPAKKDDASEIIKLKASKLLNLNPPDIHLGYQVLSRDNISKVLAVVVNKDTIVSYEDACLESGFDVRRISIHSFNLLNLFSQEASMQGNYSVIIRLGDYFSIMFFKEGILDFYRCKAVSGSDGAGIKEISSSFLSYRGKNPDMPLENIYLLDMSGDFAEMVKKAVGVEVKQLALDTVLKLDPAESAGQFSLGHLAALGAAAGI